MRRIRKPGGPDILSGLGSTDCQPPMSMQRYDYSFRLTNYDLSKTKVSIFANMPLPVVWSAVKATSLR